MSGRQGATARAPNASWSGRIPCQVWRGERQRKLAALMVGAGARIGRLRSGGGMAWTGSGRGRGLRHRAQGYSQHVGSHRLTGCRNPVAASCEVVSMSLPFIDHCCDRSPLASCSALRPPNQLRGMPLLPSSDPAHWQARAQDSWRAANQLVTAKTPSPFSAASRLYYAVYQAAMFALLRLEPSSKLIGEKHGKIWSELQGKSDATLVNLGRRMSKVYALRCNSDYCHDDCSVADARKAVADSVRDIGASGI